MSRGSSIWISNPECESEFEQNPTRFLKAEKTSRYRRFESALLHYLFKGLYARGLNTVAWDHGTVGSNPTSPIYGGYSSMVESLIVTQRMSVQFALSTLP